MWGELALSLRGGNFYLLAIIFLGFIGSILMCERFIMLQFVYNIDFSKFLNNLRKMIASEDHERAINLCKSASKTSLPKIALRALEAVENDPSTTRGTIEEETIEFLPHLEARLTILPVLATLIMLMGVLGTIDSLWWSFHSVDILDTARKQSSLAHGIAGALNPTAISIIVAMLILAGHQILSGIAVRILDRIHYGIAVLNNLLVPEELPTVVAAAAAAPPPVAMTSADTAALSDEDAPDETQEVASNEAFDDTVVDDIKDEEEII